ncbi:MAG TPA: SRPBCC domain-containing protein [Blastocatellia bacterium]
MVQYNDTVSIDRVSAAISDPTRRAILERLSKGSARISDAAEPFPITLTGFCKHVKVLERAGLIRRTRHGRENTLELTPDPLRGVARWIQKYERFWTERLDRLEAFFKVTKGGIMTELTEITVRRTIPASPEAVFDVWMDPKSPGGPWFGAQRVIVNPVVDGLFYVAVGHEERTWPHYGRFIKIYRPRQVEYTWVSEGTRGIESKVLVTFERHADGTEVTLRHSGVPDDEMGRRHQEGWTWVLSQLEQAFTGHKTAPASK